MLHRVSDVMSIQGCSFISSSGFNIGVIRVRSNYFNTLLRVRRVRNRLLFCRHDTQRARESGRDMEGFRSDVRDQTVSGVYDERRKMTGTAVVGAVSYLIAKEAPTNSVRQQMASGIAGICLLTTIMEIINGKSA